MNIRFYTSTPLNVARGSGTYTGLITLVRALQDAGHRVDITAPTRRLPNYTLERLLFNYRLDPPPDCDVTVGVDMDGFRLAGAGGPPHIATIKGVIADEAQFESGYTRASLSLQAAYEGRHVRRANAVITTSRYSAGQIHDFYGVARIDAIVPEPIDLDSWNDLFERHGADPDPGCFTILSVCRFYRRKRINLLLQAAAMLRKEIPKLRVRIVGDGPEDSRWRALAWELGLVDVVTWLGDVSQEQLARELKACDVFCLPSVQEGFGIVLLEAMAAGKPIVGAQAGAIPEVAPCALLAEPENAQSLAHQLTIVCSDHKQRVSMAQEGQRRVQQFDAPRVARAFVEELDRILNRRVARARG